MVAGSWHCTGGSDQDHPQEKEMQNGKIQTGSYKDKNGKTVYTTDVVATNVEFLDSKPAPVDMGATKAQAEALFGEDVGFSYTNDGMPF